MHNPIDRKVRSIWMSFALLCALALAGTVGFYVIGHGQRSWFDGLWFTLHILTTVGDTGVAHTAAEMRWSAALMIVGVLVVAYLGINIASFVLEGEMRQLLGRRQLQSKIKKLKGHFIVCGYGRMGRALCDALSGKGADFIVIENDPMRIAGIDDHGHKYIAGDAMTEECLKAARIENATGLASCLTDDASNVFVTLTAKSIAPAVTVVSKANYEEGGKRLVRAGADHVLSPSMLAANRAMTKLMLPAVDELLEVVVHGPDIEISKVSLHRLPRAANCVLRELALPARANLLVVAVIHDDGTRSFNPTPDTRMEPGDELIVVGPRGGVEKMVELFGQG